MENLKARNTSVNLNLYVNDECATAKSN